MHTLNIDVIEYESDLKKFILSVFFIIICILAFEFMCIKIILWLI